MGLDRNEGLYALNAVCPYFTMFPLDFPITVLRELGASRKRKGIVVDPFCGRGTTNLAALTFGKNTIGVDSAPVAIAVTAGKLVAASVSVENVLGAAKELLAESASEIPEGDFWSLAFQRPVLKGICAIREGLLSAEPTPARDFLRAIMLGALHGPLRVNGSSSYFSNQMPRTYASKPNYSVQYWKKHKLIPPKVDILFIIEARARRVLTSSSIRASGSVHQADSRAFDWSNAVDRDRLIRWVITSPPYYGLRTYRPDQWLREWFLGGAAQVTYSSEGQVRHSSRTDFVEDLFLVWNSLAEAAAPDAKLVFRFGSINDRPLSALDLAWASLRGTRWRVDEIRSAGRASCGRRQSQAFNRPSRPALTEIDVWCSLC
jgi:DNA methylase